MYHRGGHSVYSLQIHLVFVVKRRGKLFKRAMLDELAVIFTEVCDKLDASLIEFNGEPDHVHLLVAYPPKVSVSLLVQRLKGVSGRWLKQRFPETARFWSVKRSKGSIWSPSYFASSVGGATLDVVKQYIQEQQTPE